MTLSEWFDGPEVELQDMLSIRDLRARKQEELLSRFKQASLLQMTMNIPGNVKTSAKLQAVFERFYQKVRDSLAEACVYAEASHMNSGSQAYLVVEGPALALKEKMVDLEEKEAEGRLFDLDVLYIKDDTLQVVKRQEIGGEARICYVCDQEAKACARSQKHSIEETRQAILNLLEDIG